MEVILLCSINVRLSEPWGDREEELELALAGSGLGNVTSHLTSRRSYRRTGVGFGR